MKVGAEPRKVAILAVLLVVAAYLMYSNIVHPDTGIPDQARSSVAGPAPTPSAPPAAAPPAPPAQAPAPAPRRASAAPRKGRQTMSQEWIPSVGARRPEDRPDPMTVDPSLRLDLLARLKEVTIAGGERSLFDFSQPPPPKVAEPKILPKPVAQETPADNGTKPEPATAASKPPPPPIPLKFYGFVTGIGPRRAFFLNADEIFVASEGDLVQKRYKIIRIGVSSAVVADTQHDDHQQSIPLEAMPVS